MAHTLGPWYVDDDTSPNNLNVVAEVVDYVVCIDNGIPFGDVRADANLIAASPRMLEACEKALAFLNLVDDTNATNGRATPEEVLELRGFIQQVVAEAKGSSQ